MKHLKDYFDRYFKKTELKQFDKIVADKSSSQRQKQLELAQKIYLIQEELKNTLNKDLANKVRIQSYKNENLYLLVPNSLFAQEVKFFETILKENLLEKNVKIKKIFYLIDKDDYII